MPAKKKQKVTFEMQKDLVAYAEEAVKTGSVISYAEACHLWTLACDGPGVTENEFKTLEHILENYKFTEKGTRYLTDLAIKQVSGKSQYRSINNVRYDRSCLDLAAHLAKDGKIDIGDAKQLWADVEDGPGVTECERQSLQYVMDNYKLTEGGKAFLLQKMREQMNLKLMYFKGRGLMEVPRTLLATVGKFAPADFEDFRFEDFAAFGAAQASGELGHHNMNRVPLCMHMGITIGQGPSINRYLAKTFGLFGETDAQAAQIDNICEHVAEIGVAFGKVMPYGNSFDDANKAPILTTWFTTEASAGDKERSDRHLLWHLNHLEHCVGSEGFACGEKVSLADALIYNKLGEACANLGDKGGPFGTAPDTTAKALAGFPKLSKIVSNFGESPNMVKYLSQRGDQGF